MTRSRVSARTHTNTDQHTYCLCDRIRNILNLLTAEYAYSFSTFFFFFILFSFRLSLWFAPSSPFVLSDGLCRGTLTLAHTYTGGMCVREEICVLLSFCPSRGATAAVWQSTSSFAYPARLPPYEVRLLYRRVYRRASRLPTLPLPSNGLVGFLNECGFLVGSSVLVCR